MVWIYIYGITSTVTVYDITNTRKGAVYRFCSGLSVFLTVFENPRLLTMYFVWCCPQEDDLSDLLRYEKRHLRSLLNTLKNEKFLKSRMRVETDAEGKSTRHSYYFISYNVFVNVVKYKLDHIRKKIELEERNTSSRASFKWVMFVWLDAWKDLIVVFKLTRISPCRIKPAAFVMSLFLNEDALRPSNCVF